VASLKKEVAEVRADLACRDRTIQLQDKKVIAFQGRCRFLESKAAEANRAFDSANRATELAEELRRELRIKNSSNQLNDFL
jgi:hypothetical protein